MCNVNMASCIIYSIIIARHSVLERVGAGLRDTGGQDS